MLQLRALNEDQEDSCSSNENELQVTGEAEETIVVIEYLRALNLKLTNQQEHAFHIFLELLETEMLDKTFVDKTDKLFLVKYNCYRNVGLIYNEKQQQKFALNYLIKAVEMDETDIHTMHYLANLALNIDQVQLAKLYYEKCIEQNHSHWPSLDGMLQVFCSSGNIIEAFAWAMHCFRKDTHYKRAIRALSEISTRFATSIYFLIELFEIRFKLDGFIVTTANTLGSNHFPSKCKAFPTKNQLPVFDYTENKIHNLDWLTLGNFLLQMYTHTKSINQECPILFELNDLIGKFFFTDTFKYRNDKTTKSLHSASDIVLSGINIKASNMDLTTELETKSRRRGSELKILEQWGWHKSRRSSRKKSVYDLVDPIESTADGFLKRALSKYFGVSFENKISPFSGNKFDSENDFSNQLNHSPTCSNDQFIEDSGDKFEIVIKELQNVEFDLFISIKLYVHSISSYWDKYIPTDLREIFEGLFKLFYEYQCSQTWNQLSAEEISNTFRTALFYLELLSDRNQQFNEKSETGRDCRNLLNHLRLYSVYLPEKDYILLYTRYIWLNYVVLINENNSEAALQMLLQLKQVMSNLPQTFYVFLPNQRNNTFYKQSFIQQLCSSLTRKINLDNIKYLYDMKKYEAVVDILKDNLMYVPETPINDELLCTASQIEILLECLWMLERFKDCIVWAEKALKYTTDLFLSFSNDNYRQKNWGRTINFILTYMLTLMEKESSYILPFEYIARMIQSIHKLLTKLLDPQQEKNTFNQYTIDCSKAWSIVYYILEREDDITTVSRKSRSKDDESFAYQTDEESLCSSIMMFFVAHELLGRFHFSLRRRQWCSKENSRILFMMLDVIGPKLRAPLLEPYREIINECLEQTTYCLYGYPPKKGRMRHVQDHEAIQESLSYEKAIQLFDIYRPDVLPEFNSYKIDSISADAEVMFQHILSILSDKFDIAKQTTPMMNFINDADHTLPPVYNNEILSLKIKPIFYLLADFYFKNRDFSKAINYYVMDLTIEPRRFDSWAGISLSKASKCETMLNSTEVLSPQDFLRLSSHAMKCFDQCLKVNESNSQLWVEHGSFAYNVYSYCSRTLKFWDKSFSNDMKEFISSQKEHYGSIACTSFNKVSSDAARKDGKNIRNLECIEDEKWLYHYMLGKIAEKKRDLPIIYLSHYFKAAKCLYECRATYPIKVNHSNPSHLSIEALEIFYRINAAIMKYVEEHSLICKKTALLFKTILKELNISPFAVNRAKINDSSFQQKLTRSGESSQIETTEQGNIAYTKYTRDESGCTEKFVNQKNSVMCSTGFHTVPNEYTNVRKDRNSTEKNVNDKSERRCRKASQESGSATNTTASNATSSVSSGSESPTSVIESSETDSDGCNRGEVSISTSDRDAIFQDCIKNIEECVSRFPEHYKSIYRLAYHFMYAPGATQSNEKCRELLLGMYKTTLGNQIAGLFTERRSNNFFNGIWRIPSSDIDRPGCFAAHLSKCVIILINTLIQINDHETLLDLAIQLYRMPDSDKKYLNDWNRNHLFENSLDACINIFYNVMKSLSVSNNDNELLSLLVNIFKAYRKCAKHIHIQKKEYALSIALVDAYKIFIKNKVNLTDNTNFLDLAIKLCTYELNYRKTLDKIYETNKTIAGSAETSTTLITPMRPISASYIPGVSKQRRTTASKILSDGTQVKYIPTGPSAIVSTFLPGLTITPSYIPGVSKQRRTTASKILSDATQVKYIPTGPSAIVSIFLPGLTISALDLMTKTSETATDSYDNKTQPFVPHTDYYLTNLKSKGVAEHSQMYLNNFSNTSNRGISFDNDEERSINDNTY
ncbi:calcineurin-binding protein cabin-1-like isoform X3 [Malaya genurostris]|uniref:calcineurin-binding protein cabin-1-like isoform X3 n=1 Tax=Malaya genurostris TaxID=325434 RepID=UPI0026F409E5|nr:calcineurin-binding protein cabin-1-like isoform X3 [Malaya genurostris]